MCAWCHGGQNWTSDPLEQEIQFEAGPPEDFQLNSEPLEKQEVGPEWWFSG